MRLEPDGAMARIRTAQAAVLASLLSNVRLNRMVEFGAMPSDAADAYTVDQMLGDLRRGIWSELSSSSVRIDGFRQNLQFEYLSQLGAKINPAPVIANPNLPAAFAFTQSPPPDQARALMRMQLMDLDGQLRSALPRAANAETRAHIIEARNRIDVILHPEK